VKIKHYFDIHHSLISRVVFWTVLASLLVFLISFGGAMFFAQKNISRQADEKVNICLDIAVSSLDDELKGVEDAARKTVEYLKFNFPENNDEVYTFLESLTLSNTFVQGVVMAFETSPSHPDGYAPYIMEQEGRYILRDLSKTQPDYSQNPWYLNAVKQNKGNWNKALVEINGTKIISYSCPFYSSEEEFMGVLALDVNVEDIREQIGLLKPYANSSFYVLDEDRNILIQSENPEMEGKHLEDKNEDMRLYYAPTKYGKLTVAVELPVADILAPVKNIRRSLIVLSLLGILALALTIVIVLRRQMGSVVKFTQAARSIAAGNFNTPIPETKDPNELQRLGKALDEMQTSLRTYMADLAATQQEKGKIENEIHIASGIQKAMLPKIYPPYPDRDDLDIYGILLPAREVGGDLYDFFIRDEKLYFCIGDVSGKGVPASLVMAVTRSLIRIVSMRESSPGSIMRTINDSMTDMNETAMFVTLFIGVLDLASGKLAYCNGGHNAPLLSARGEVRMLDVVANLPVGILDGKTFVEQQTQLDPGDMVFLYTDGLTESEDSAHRLFGDDAMIDTVKASEKNNARRTIDEMVAKVRLHADGAEQSDDLTMLAVRYMGPQHEQRFVKELKLRNRLSETASLEPFVEELGTEFKMEKSEVMRLNLALEEVVVNIISYAYPPDTDGEISLVASGTDDCLKLVISDAGRPFDPTKQADPDITLDADDRQIGGLGIYLVRNIVDTMFYERVDRHNVLTLRKYKNNAIS